ncbi:hypothetical protein VTI28DRAFT_8616 [Corynascus sepedonium]
MIQPSVAPSHQVLSGPGDPVPGCGACAAEPVTQHPSAAAVIALLELLHHNYQGPPVHPSTDSFPLVFVSRGLHPHGICLSRVIPQSNRTWLIVSPSHDLVSPDSIQTWRPPAIPPSNPLSAPGQPDIPKHFGFFEDPQLSPTR